MTDTALRLTAALADRYRIERELGAGGMATVYLAHDLKHNRKVAVKVLKPELAAALGAERFVREIETTAALHHPHILPLYDSGEAGGFLYYVLPYMEGESLRDRLDREKQLPLDDALHVAREVADALSYAHARGVIHRDIKPENILLESGHAVVADFGIAKAVVSAGTETLTQTGIAIGSPRYMSPEQAAGAKDLDGRSDLYSLACVLYEMLTGQPPFTGPTVESVIRQHMIDAPRPVYQLRPAVPPIIADVLTRALAKNPADRFSPAATFAAALVTRSAGDGADTARRFSRVGIGIAVIGALATLTTLVVVARRTGAGPAITIGRTTQVTRAAGLEVDPALSPNGETIAYAAGAPATMQIYVRQVSGGRPVALTSDTSANFRWPRWSPDGSQIAYQANDGIYVVPALGGVPRRLTRIDFGTFRFSPGAGTPLTGFDWSPDGLRIASTRGYGNDGITLTTLATGDTVNLPSPSAPSSPVWSPDGQSIAVVAGNPVFIFGTGYFGNSGTNGIWIVHVDGSPQTRVTPDSALNISPQWASDGRALFWVSDRDGSRDIYEQRISRDGRPEGTVQRLTTGTDAQGLTLTRQGTRMAYSRLNIYSSIWSIPVPARGPVSIRGATRLTTGNETIEAVDVSSDGRWLVFDSDRNGNADLYVMPATGGEARQITTDSASDYSARWSPDGRRIAFHSLRNGNRDIYTVAFDGTQLTRRSSSADEELDPDWSPNGEAIVHEVISAQSARHGFAVLRLADNAAPRFFSLPAADFARWAPGGREFLYHAPDGLRSHRVDDGADSLRVSNATIGAEAFYAAWSRDGATLYYLARSREGWSIRAVPAAGGTSTTLVDFDDPTRQHTKYGFSTDGKVFYFTIGAPESDIWVADLTKP